MRSPDDEARRRRLVRPALLAAALGLLAALPRPVAAETASADQEDLGPAEPLPPIETPPPKVRTRPEPPAPAESPAAAPAPTQAQEEPAEPQPTEPAESQPEPEPEAKTAPEQPTRPRAEYDSKAAFLAEIGAFTSGIGGGFAADLGLRIHDFSLRYDYRLALPDNSDAGVFSTHTVRVAWHRPLATWANAYAGAGFGTVKLTLHDPWTDVAYTGASSGVAAIDAGLVLEYGPLSMAAVGVEVLIPFDASVLAGPTFFLTLTVTPVALLYLL